MDPEQVQLLIAAGADVNVEDIQGIKPSMHASILEEEVSVELLLERRASSNAKTKKGVTTLEIALENDSANVVK